MQSKDKLLDTFRINNKNYIISVLEKVHLSFSELKEVLENLSEMEYSTKIDIFEFLNGIESDFVGNRKKDGKTLLNFVKKERTPVIYIVMESLKNSIKKVKNTILKVSYPQNLEGEGIKLEILLKSEGDVDKIIKHLEKNRANLKDIVKTVNSGGGNEIY